MQILLDQPVVETEGERAAKELKAAIATVRKWGIHRKGQSRADALQSVQMGMGTSIDKRTTIQPVLRGFWGLDALDAMYLQGGLFRRISEAPAVDAIAPGWTTDDGEDQDSTSAFDRQHDLKKKVLDAMRFGRGYGRAHLLMVTDDDAPLDQPLVGQHNILAIHVIMRRECIPLHWCSDIRDPYFGDVDVWNVVPIRVGVFAPSTPVHASRILTFRGLDSPLTPVAGFDLGRGLSVPDLYWEEIRDLTATWASLATMSLEASLPTLSIGEKDTDISGSSGLGDDSDDGIEAAMQLLKLSRSAWGMTVVNGNDKFSRDNVSFAGIRDVVTALEERVCSVEGIPGVRVFGQAPGGLSTDDRSGRATYVTLVNGIRIDRAEPALQKIYTTQFGPKDRQINWGDVETLDATQIATVSKINAERDKILLECGAITPQEIRARYLGDEVLPNPVVVGPLPAGDKPIETPAPSLPQDLAGDVLPEGYGLEPNPGSGIAVPHE